LIVANIAPFCQSHFGIEPVILSNNQTFVAAPGFLFGRFDDDSAVIIIPSDQFI